MATTGPLALGKCGLAAALSSPAGKWCKQSGDQWLEKAAGCEDAGSRMQIICCDLIF